MNLQPNFPPEQMPKPDKSTLIFLANNTLDYKTLLFEYLFPLVRASLKTKGTLLSLLEKQPSASYMINRTNFEMISNALPLCKRFVSLLNSKMVLREMFVKVVEELRANNLETAQFFADKLVTLTNHAAISVYLLAEVYFRAGKFTKVNYLFHKNDLLFGDENFLDLTARSLLRLKKYEQCLKIAGNSPKITLYNQEGIKLI
jgi:predicted Zn-dependent protease